MPQNRIALRQDSPIQLNDGDICRRVQLRDASLFVVRVFFKAVARVIIRDAGIFPHETNDLPAASGLEVEIMQNWDAADGFIGGAFGAAALGGRHFESVEPCMKEDSRRCNAKGRGNGWTDGREMIIRSQSSGIFILHTRHKDVNRL